LALGADQQPPSDHVGEQARLEPRKYVYQLTGLIRLGDETVPYLYGDDESRVNMLDELVRIGGAHVVEFLFSQCAESAHAESAHAESAHKDSTVLQGSTALEESTKKKSHRPVSTPPPTPRRKLTRNGYEPSAAEREKRSASEKPVDDPSTIPATDHTELECFILSVVSKTIKRVADTYRKVLDEKVVWYHEGKRYDSPSPNELWDTNPDYQRFVLESVIPSIQKKGRLTPVSITSWLSGAGTYQWFFIDHKPGETKTPQDVQAAEDAAMRAAKEFGRRMQLKESESDE
jgi:hypothetical protein